jgi:hypothetical protein
MYATCIHCRHGLGSNQRIEHFPTGRKLAFDVAKGRLWVVCPACGQWNLSPLEERWEAIEECEKLFRVTPRRASTDEIAIATIPGTLDLVRVGRPQRPEFAAWRYGERLLRKRRAVQWKVGGAGLIGAAGVAGAFVAAGPMGLVPIAVAPVLAVYMKLIASAAPRAAARNHLRDLLRTVGIELTAMESLQYNQLELARASNAEGWRLRLTSAGNEMDIEGSRAYQVLGGILPRLSAYGASRRDVDAAVALVDASIDPARHVSQTVDRICRSGYAMSDLGEIPMGLRLSLEMASQEESERRALEGELAELEATWRRAEEIAAIADDLLLPSSITTFLARHRSGGSR